MEALWVRIRTITRDDDGVVYVNAIAGLGHLISLDFWAKDAVADEIYNHIQCGWVIRIVYHPATREIVGISGETPSSI